MPAVSVTNLTVSNITVSFSGGQIASVSAQYVLSGVGGESWQGNHLWQLTPAESASGAASNFVTALVNKIAAATGLIVATS